MTADQLHSGSNPDLGFRRSAKHFDDEKNCLQFFDSAEVNNVLPVTKHLKANNMW